MASQYGSARERFHYFNGLTGLIKALEGKYTTVDLRNDSYVTGKVDDVDGFMNIVMTDAIFTDANSQEYSFESFFVHNRNIRYVHIPETVPIVDTVKGLLDKIGPKQHKSDKQFTKKSYKATQAMSRHMETVASIVKKTNQKSDT